MPALTVVNIKQSGNTPVSEVVLDGADTFSVSKSNNESLILKNGTGGDLTITMIGADAPATVFCQGVGTVTVSPESVAVTDGASVSVYLSSLREKLAGEVTITGGTGLTAQLVSY
jgi:hypothetical protein